MVTRDQSGMNVLVFRPDQATAAVEALRTAPFLADRKLIVLDGFLEAASAVQQDMIGALAAKPESTVAVFFEDGSAEELAKSPLFDRLKEEKFTEEFLPLTGAAAEQFAAAEAAAFNATFGPQATRLLVELIGGDSWQIHLETSKLAAYAGGVAAGVGGTSSASQSVQNADASAPALITEAMVRELVNDGREEPVFAFLDACTDGRSGEAMRLLERLFQGGTSQAQVVAMLTKHFRGALAARDLLERGHADPSLLARTIGLHPYVAGKAVAFARCHRLVVLQTRYERLVQMERALKSGGPETRVTLALFASECAAAPSVA